MLEYLMEVGPVSYNGMGMAPIGYSEIKDWSEITDTRISPWDAHVIRELSRAYVGEYNESKDPARPAPYESEMDIESKRAAVVAGFKGLGKRNNG